MEKETITLSDDWLQSDLYQITDNTPPPTIRVSSNPTLTILVLVEDYTSENQIFLSKILQAANYQLDNNVNLVIGNATAAYNIHYLRNISPTTYYFSFGLKPAQFSPKTDWKPHKIYTVPPSKFLLTYSLAQLSATPALKKELWNAMQVFLSGS